MANPQDLFQTVTSDNVQSVEDSLALRMRPQCLQDCIGQEHLIKEGSLFYDLVTADLWDSFILYGPPGTGKTSIAMMISRYSAVNKCHFESLNAVEVGVPVLRKKIVKAQQRKRQEGVETVLFIDEIHHFNSSQQDVLLPYLEQKVVRFIGATTQNPHFYLNGPLHSRAHIFTLNALTKEHIIQLLDKALQQDEQLQKYAISIEEPAKLFLAEQSAGDARKSLRVLDLAVQLVRRRQQKTINLDLLQELLQTKSISYDKQGDEHYNTISAFIKSIRGSDPDAALYWLAKMLTAGEDPRYIIRRLVIAASEDIGLADSQAVQVVLACAQSYEMIGLPEGRIPLAHATVYLATAPKSASAYQGINEAMADVKKNSVLAVPSYLQTKSQKQHQRDNGASPETLAYFYSHDYPGNYVPQSYLPEGRVFYRPTSNGMELRIKQRLDYWQEQHENKVTK